MWPHERDQCCNGGRHVIRALWPPITDEEDRALITAPGMAHHSRYVNNLLAFTAVGTTPRRADGGRGLAGDPPGCLYLHGSTYHLNVPGCLNDSPIHYYYNDADAEARLSDEEPRVVAAVNAGRAILARLNPLAGALASMRDVAPAQRPGALTATFRRQFRDMQVAAVYDNGGSTLTPPDRHGVIFRLRDNGEVARNAAGEFVKEFISLSSPMYDLCQYPLLHERGVGGWYALTTREAAELGLPRRPVSDTGTELTLMDYMKASVFQSERLHWQGRLAQQWILDMHARYETMLLNYLRRSTTLQGQLREHAAQRIRTAPRARAAAAENATEVGRRVYLPASMPGCKRYQQNRIDDAMALVARYGVPSVMLTMTANPNWPEITAALLPGQRATDRPDLVVRVFREKHHELLRDLRSGAMLGRRSQYILSVIEYQGHGLIHAHITVRFQGQQPTPEELDASGLISAELPDLNDCESFRRGLPCEPECEVHRYHRLVTTFMQHEHRDRCQQRTGRCQYHFPHAPTQRTHIDERGFPVYRRRGAQHAWTVEHNRRLLLKYECHLHVTLCVMAVVIKYLYMYAYKGPDFVDVIISEADRLDETQVFSRMRYVCASYAVTRAIGYDMNVREPSVGRVAPHVPGGDLVVFNEAQRPAERARRKVTEVERYFARPAGERFDHLLMLQYMDAYVTGAEPPRSRMSWPDTIPPPDRRHVALRTQPKVHRMYRVLPNAGEVYYVRQLLLHVPARSFVELRTVDGVLHDTFAAATVARGLVATGREGVAALDEAARALATPHEMRSLFVMLLIDGAAAYTSHRMATTAATTRCRRRWMVGDRADAGCAVRDADYCRCVVYPATRYPERATRWWMVCPATSCRQRAANWGRVVCTAAAVLSTAIIATVTTTVVAIPCHAAPGTGCRYCTRALTYVDLLGRVAAITGDSNGTSRTGGEQRARQHHLEEDDARARY